MALNLEEGWLFGRVIGALGIVVDLGLHGGELIFGLITGILGQPELLATLLIYLERLAERTGWIPTGFIDDALTILLIAILLIYVGRILEGATDNS